MLDRKAFYDALNRKAFYDALRGGAMFPRSITSGQVAGMERLLDVWERYFPNDSDFLLAYNLGTSFHETDATMQPIVERGARAYFDKYEPGTPLGKMLGNTVKGDGFRFKGEGDVQNTGRANAAKATRRINEVFGLGVDLVANPEKRGDPFISAMSLFLGNKEGWWTGKDLLDYIDGIPESEQEDLREFAQARRVVNGTDKAEKIAGYAMAFYRALQAARKAGPAPTWVPTISGTHTEWSAPLPEPLNSGATAALPPVAPVTKQAPEIAAIPAPVVQPITKPTPAPEPARHDGTFAAPASERSWWAAIRSLLLKEEP